MLGSWMNTIKQLELRINEFETCKAVKNDNGVFVVHTESEKTKQPAQYRSRSIIIAVGGRGTPMNLKVPGEDLKILAQPTEPVFANEPQKGGAL